MLNKSMLPPRGICFQRIHAHGSARELLGIQRWGPEFLAVSIRNWGDCSGGRRICMKCIRISHSTAVVSCFYSNLPWERGVSGNLSAGSPALFLILSSSLASQILHGQMAATESIHWAAWVLLKSHSYSVPTHSTWDYSGCETLLANKSII